MRVFRTKISTGFDINNEVTLNGEKVSSFLLTLAPFVRTLSLPISTIAKSNKVVYVKHPGV